LPFKELAKIWGVGGIPERKKKTRRRRKESNKTPRRVESEGTVHILGGKLKKKKRSSG